MWLKMKYKYKIQNFTFFHRLMKLVVITEIFQCYKICTQTHQPNSFYCSLLRWKEECTTIAQKYEDKLKDARADMTQLKKRNSEVTKLLKDSQEKLLQVSYSKC